MALIFIFLILLLSIFFNVSNEDIPELLRLYETETKKLNDEINQNRDDIKTLKKQLNKLKHF